MAESSFFHINSSTLTPLIQTEDGLSLSLSAPPKSDIYASPGPPPLYVYTAPVVCRRIKKSSFALARTTVTARWKLQFDQGGLVFTIPTLDSPLPDASNANDFKSHPSWVKVGIETNDGAPCNALMVWLIKEATRILIRKVPWVFLGGPDSSEDILVGVYAAQPDPDDKSGGQNFQVDFSDFRLMEVDETQTVR
ncbi:Fc.00g055200.m01.CDS01 [Cosmosporella sp. VM-42]